MSRHRKQTLLNALLMSFCISMVFAGLFSFLTFGVSREWPVAWARDFAFGWPIGAALSLLLGHPIRSLSAWLTRHEAHAR